MRETHQCSDRKEASFQGDLFASSEKQERTRLIAKEYPTRCGTIRYWVSERMDPNRRTLVLLPGLTADHRLFEKQLEAFGQEENVLVWDPPGHASSQPFTLDFTLEDKAAWLKGILDTEGIEKPVLVGQSMGGYVAQMFEELYPGTAGGLVFVDSAPLQRKYMTAPELWLLKRTEPMYRAFPWKLLVWAGAKGCAETPYGQELMKQMMLSYDGAPEWYIHLVSHGYRMLAEAVEQDRAYRIGCPAVLLCGTHDHAGSTKSYNKKWQKETGLPTFWISGAGHNSNTDAPEEVNRIIRDFLQRISKQKSKDTESYAEAAEPV